MLLTAGGAQSVRVWAQIVGLIVLFLTSSWLMEELGVMAMLIALSITAVVLILIYTVAAITKRIIVGFSPLTVLVGGVVLVLSIPHKSEMIDKIKYIFFC